MKEGTAETIVGAVVVLAAAGFLFFAMARAGGGEGAGGYQLDARFNRIDGISVGSDVRMAGVKIGVVSKVALEQKNYMAEVTMSLSPSIKVPEDSTAKVASDGLLGGAFVSIEPGGAEGMLKPGQELTHTQGSVDLLTVLASALGGANAKSGAGTAEQAGP
jgi:phospholipid/cholesterol/gamma-HCH transport system substrate-binding protein